jgi:hypothetical protein
MAFLLLLVCTASAVIAQPQECLSQQGDPACEGADVSTDEVDEAVSLIQVEAKRLTKATGTPNSTEALVQVAENTSAVSATSPAKASGLAESRKATALALLAYFQNSETRSSAVAIVILVAVVGVAAVCLLAMVLQPDNSRDAWQHRPGQRQAGSFRNLQAGSFRTLPQPYMTSQGAMPYPVSQNQVPSRGQGSMPRVSVPPSAKNSMTSLPRVKQAVSGSSLSLTPAGSIMPRTQKPSGGSALSLTPAGSIMPPKKDEPEMPAPELTGNAPRRPVAICPFLVLPHCETFLAVPINQLVAGAKTVEVLGLSGSALLRVTIKDASVGRVIEVSMSPQQSPALATITEAPEHGPRAGMMEIKACKGGSGAAHYGWLRPSKNYFGSTCHVLQSGGDDVMTVVTDASQGSCQLYAGGNGDLLAQAYRSGDGERIFNAEDLEIRVTPGMDAVLALLCVPAIALFGQGEALFTFPPSRLSA